MHRSFLLVMAKLALTISVAAQTQSTLRLQPYVVKLSNGIELQGEQGILKVPSNRAKRDGKTMELYFVRLPGTLESPPSPILFLTDGPGGAATAFFRTPGAAETIAAFRGVGDLILLDQRGTGQSKPVPVCPSDDPVPDFAFTDTAALLKKMQAGTVRCAAEWEKKGVDLSAFNSRDAADDLEDLRLALGVEKLHLVGFGYGAHLALAAMKRHPEGLSRVVLIATEGPGHTYKLPSTFDQQLRKLSLLAANQPATRQAVPDMMVLLKRVLAKLEKEPVTVTVRDRAQDRDVAVRVGKSGLLRILRADVGDGNDFVVFPALLLGIDQGDLTVLGRYVEKRYNQTGGPISLMPILTNCSSGASAGRMQQIRGEMGTSIFGAFANYPYPEICSAVGNPDLGDEYRGPLASDVQTLLISGTLDSDSPPFQAEEVRWGMTKAVHLIVDHAGHEDMLFDSQVQRAVFDFLAGKDVSTRRIARPRPRFLSTNEAREFKP